MMDRPPFASPFVGIWFGEALEAAQWPDGLLAVMAARGAILFKAAVILGPGCILV